MNMVRDNLLVMPGLVPGIHVLDGLVHARRRCRT